MEDKTYIAVNPVSPSHPIAKLTWEDGDATKEMMVNSEGITIGRSAENNLVVQDLEASRFHSKILPENENLIVVDLDSTNGTFLNEDRVSGNREVHDGDRIRIGQIEFVVSLLPSESLEESLIEESLQGKEIPFDRTFVVLPESQLPRLVVTVGMGKGTEFSLTKDRMSIGRASSNKKWDIDLVDKAVSRPHAELVKKNEQWTLVDLNSANGTKINGARVSEPHVLQDGDVVTFGETTLIARLNPGD